MKYKEFAVKTGLWTLTAAGILSLLTIMHTCESKLEQKIKNEMIVDSPKEEIANYQNSVNYLNYKNNLAPLTYLL